MQRRLVLKKTVHTIDITLSSKNLTEVQQTFPSIALFQSCAPFPSSSAYAPSATKRTSCHAATHTHTHTHTRTTVQALAQRYPGIETRSMPDFSELTSLLTHSMEQSPS